MQHLFFFVSDMLQIDVNACITAKKVVGVDWGWGVIQQ